MTANSEARPTNNDEAAAGGQRGAAGGPSGALHGQLELRLPLLGGRGTLTTTLDLDGQGAFGAGSSRGTGQVDATVTLRSPAALHVELPHGRGVVSGKLDTDGQVQVKLAIPHGVERLDGEIAIDGPLGLTIPLPAGAATLELPTRLDGTVDIRTTAPLCFCLDAQGNVAGPLALRLPVPGGELDLNITLSGNTTLRMGIPGGHGQLQAHGHATGPVALTLVLPANRGHIIARASINTPVTFSMVLPDGRAKLAAQDTITSEVNLHVALPRGGQIAASGAIHSLVHGVVFLPSGRGELQATAPIHTTVHLKQIPIPGSNAPLTVDIGIDGTGEATMDLPGRGANARLCCEVTLPLAPLVRLVRAEVERQVHVERMELRPPHLTGPYELALPLYVEARRGVLVRVEVIAHLHIDPASKQIELRSVEAHGLNAAGRAASTFYLNRRVFKPLRHIRLFDPSTMLPAARIETLAFTSASADTVVVGIDMTIGGAQPSIGAR